MSQLIQIEYLKYLACVIRQSPELRKKLTQPQDSEVSESIPILSESLPHDVNIPRLHALTIGIDKYRYRPLKGCVADADAVDDYLQSKLCVPASQIMKLRDNAATREAIIRSIKALSTNNDIQFGDPILIYYAGHGADAPTPPKWRSSETRTQMLIPFDCEMDSKGGIHGIPDRTLGGLLKQLADKKGNNITVILDSCFSGSCTRSSPGVDPSLRTRSIQYQRVLPDNLDDEILCPASGKTRCFQAQPEFNNAGLKSHILLSACGAGERAWESKGRGLFTKALLDTLHGIPIDQVTYKELIFRIGRLSTQSPQCEGVHQNRIVFDAKVPHPTRIIHHGHCEPRSKNFIICAGLAHGVTKGSVFNLWGSLDSYRNWRNEKPMAVVQVVELGPFESGVKPLSDSPQNITKSFIAEHIQCGQKADLILHVPRQKQMNRLFEGLVREMLSPALHRMSIQLSTPEMAYINAVTDPEDPTKIAFEVNDPEVNRRGLKRLPYKANPDSDSVHFHKIVHGFAHYEYHLRRSSGQSQICGLASDVALEFYRVEKFESGDAVELEGDNLNDASEGISLIQDQSGYLFKLRNDSKVDLYPSLFFFDSCDMSITSLYQPPTAGQGRVDPPLKAGHELLVGHGSPDSAFVVDVRGPRKSEVGFIKLFLTTEYVDFSDVPQRSPFSETSRAIRNWQSKTRVFWCTMLVPFVAHRKESAQLKGPSKSQNADVFSSNMHTDTRSVKPDVSASPWWVAEYQNHSINCHSASRKDLNHLDIPINPRGQARSDGVPRSPIRMDMQLVPELRRLVSENSPASVPKVNTSPINAQENRASEPTELSDQEAQHFRADINQLARMQADGFERLKKLEQRLNRMQDTLRLCNL